MPRPYSVDLRERALLACEDAGGCCTKTACQFRIAASTLPRRCVFGASRRGTPGAQGIRGARHPGRRAPRPMGRGLAPLGGRLDALVAERRDATLAEYADLLAAHGGERRNTPVITGRTVAWFNRAAR